jgi:hypothetical protein
MNQQLTPHPVAALFPDMPEADFASLLEDIRQHGVKIPILVHRGQILDGRQRYRACLKLKKPCPTVRWNGRDPWLEVQSRNLMRRHLAKEQVYAISKLAAEQFPELAVPIQAAKADARIRKQRKAQGSAPPGSEQALLRSQDRHKESADVIGAHLGVSGATVKRVDRLAREAPELLPKVAAGEISAKKALLQLAVLRHPTATTARTVGPFHVEPDVRRLQRTIRAEWTRCPSEHRPAFLYGLQQVFRELIAEQSAGGVPRTGTDPARVARQDALKAG